MSLLPNTTDWLGRFRMAANPGNDWRLDRAALNAESLVHRPLAYVQGSGTTVEWIRQY